MISRKFVIVQSLGSHVGMQSNRHVVIVTQRQARSVWIGAQQQAQHWTHSDRHVAICVQRYALSHSRRRVTIGVQRDRRVVIGTTQQQACSNKQVLVRRQVCSSRRVSIGIVIIGAQRRQAHSSRGVALGAKLQERNDRRVTISA